MKSEVGPQGALPLSPPDESLFFSRGRPDDPRLGDAVRRGEPPGEEIDVALVGCPSDEGVRRNRGRPGAAEGPAAIRRSLYRFPVPPSLAERRIWDAGDVVPGGTLEETHARMEEAVAWLLARARLVVVLGGGNDLSEPDVRALARTAKQLVAVNVDRHLDVRPDEPANSGTPYRRLVEGGVLDPSRLFEVAIQPRWNAASHLAWVREQGVRIVTLDEVRTRGPDGVAREVLSAAPDAGALFLGIDLDAVRAADAPGVSRPGPLGLSAGELVDLAAAFAGDPRLRLLEITELNPRVDVDDRTACLAAETVVAALEARFAEGASRDSR